MSSDLETLLRGAADGPVPAIDTGALRRRGVRRRRLVHAATATGTAAMVAIAGVGIATLVADVSPRPSVADAPEATPAPDSDGSARSDTPSDAVDGVPVTLTVEVDENGRCQLVVVAGSPDGPVSGAHWLPHERCEPTASGDDRPPVESTMLRAPAVDGTYHPEQLLIGLVGSEVEAVRVRTDLAEVTVHTVPVTTSGTVELRGYAVSVPVADGASEPERRGVTDFGDDGPLGPEQEPIGALFDLSWSVDGPPGPGFATTGRPFDDLPMGLPDEVDPVGTWRPDPSPVDLAPLGLRDTADGWFMAGDGAGGFDAREAVAERLGSEVALRELCEHVRTWLAEASQVAVEPSDPRLLANVVVHLLLGQEGIHFSDGVTDTVTKACGVGWGTDG